MCQGFSFFRAAKRPFFDPRSGAAKLTANRGSNYGQFESVRRPHSTEGLWITIEGEIGAADLCQVSEFVRTGGPPNAPRLNTDPFDQGLPGKGSQLRDFHELRSFQTRYDAAG
jgi:hypothetical protein